MQKKEQNISPIKQRILSFAGTLGISKREFYSKIGVSRGTLESRTGITEDVITKFFATYPEVNIEWLMLGKGDMLKTKRISVIKNSASTQESKDKDSEIYQHLQTFPGNILDKLLAVISDKDSIIVEQAEEIGRLKERIVQLELEKNASLESLQTAPKILSESTIDL